MGTCHIGKFFICTVPSFNLIFSVCCQWELPVIRGQSLAELEDKMSRGLSENNTLKGKLEAQLHRLLVQLEDINKDRSSMEEDEYNELKNDTKEQEELL